jgi:hypothetical protein
VYGLPGRGVATKPAGVLPPSIGPIVLAALVGRALRKLRRCDAMRPATFRAASAMPGFCTDDLRTCEAVFQEQPRHGRHWRR